MSATANPLLDVKDLTVHYGSIAALRGVSVEVAEGEAIAIIGQNGAGKSTLLGAIAGVIPHSGGEITLAGKPLVKIAAENIVRMGISLVPEGRRIFATMTVGENLQLGTTVRSDTEQAASDIEDLLERFPVLKRYYSSPAGRLSGGEQQQLAIARALVCNPKVLLLDEPSLGLAPLVIKQIFEVLDELRSSGVTVVLVEQNAVQAVEFANRTYILRSGEVVDHGAREELRQREKEIAEQYLGVEVG